jgi:hypothetical protein
LAIAAAALAAALSPAAASAVTCPLSGPDDPSFDGTALDVEGNVAAAKTGGYVQIPFQVPPGTTAIRVQYSYDQPGDVCSLPSNRNTLDVGVYEPRESGESFWGADDSRGWSGSAVRDLAIAENGFTDDATYDSNRKAFVHGFTTRAYRPGPLPAGEWAVELGLGFIDSADPDGGIDYRVRVQTTSSADWSTGNPYEPVPSDGLTVRPEAGWYAGDLHAHGEMEPGNATMTQSFDYAFEPTATGGAGLDFMTVVDHNNDVAHDNLGTYQARYPDSLIVPGTEVTTYRGHFNNQGEGPFVDFRTGSIYSAVPATPVGSIVDDSELTTARGQVPPKDAFAEIQQSGGWTQINHPTIFKNAPDQCRGCAWSYTDEDSALSTDVDAIEVQTGPAGIPSGSPTIFNPFTRQAFEYYQGALDTGAHIAAVGVSDDHQGGGGSGATYSPIGSASTVVYAEELSEQAIVDGIKGDHTYVKLFGTTSPDISLTATVPGRPEAKIGDSVAGPSASFTATVDGAASAGRPGQWSLVVLKDGDPVETVPFSGDSFTHEFDATGSGRYSLQVDRQPGTTDASNMTENYSSPIWFTEQDDPDVSNAFRVLDKERNKGKGTARFFVRVPGPGTLALDGKAVERVSREMGAADGGELALKVEAKGKKARKLERRGRAKVKPKLTYEPDGGEPASKRKKVVLRLKP